MALSLKKIMPGTWNVEKMDEPTANSDRTSAWLRRLPNDRDQRIIVISSKLASSFHHICTLPLSPCLKVIAGTMEGCRTMLNVFAAMNVHEIVEPIGYSDRAGACIKRFPYLTSFHHIYTLPTPTYFPLYRIPRSSPHLRSSYRRTDRPTQS